MSNGHDMATDGNLVELRNVTKIYQQGEINVTALDNISLDIQSGEFLGPRRWLELGAGRRHSDCLHQVRWINVNDIQHSALRTDQ